MAHTNISGVVKRKQGDKGFGFIRGDDGVEYFFHRSAAPDFDGMREGDAVVFAPTLGSGGKGPRAEHVELEG